MTNNSNVPVVAVFEHRKQAEGAIDELWHAGFPKEQIGFATPGESPRQATTTTEGLEEEAAGGAATGALAGGVVGALAGAVAVAAVPGIGAVVAGGLLLHMIVGAAAGAALGSFAGPFIALGLSPEAARKYDAHLQGGRTVLIVKTDKPGQAATILRAHGPLHIELPADVERTSAG